MDFSKFSDQSLLAIRNGDYSKLSDDELKLLKQESTGVDSSPQQPMSKTDLALNVGKELYRQYTPMGQIDEMANKAGEATAETLGKAGHPILGGAIGGTIASTPSWLANAAGIMATGGAAESGELGQVGRVLAGPGRAEAGQAMGMAERGAGINTDLVPTLKDASTSLGAWRANPQQYLNALAERLNSGIEMSPQDLSLHHKMITDLLSQEPGKLAQVFGNAKSNLGTNGVSTAAKLDQMLVQKLNQVAPGRGEAAANYAAAKMRGNIYKGTAGAGAALVGKHAILDAFHRLTGGR